MKHANAEIPEKEFAIISYTTEAVRPFIAAPRIEGNCGHPRIVTMTSSNDLTFIKRPNGDKIVLASGEHVLAVRRPTYTGKSTIVGRIYISQPAQSQSSLSTYHQADRAVYVPLGGVINYTKIPVVPNDCKMPAVLRKGKICDGLIGDLPTSDWI